MPDAAAEDDVDFIAIAGEGTVVDHGLTNQARGNPAFRRIGGEGCLQVIIPSEVTQAHPLGKANREAAYVDSRICEKLKIRLSSLNKRALL